MLSRRRKAKLAEIQQKSEEMMEELRKAQQAQQAQSSARRYATNFVAQPYYYPGETPAPSELEMKFQTEPIVGWRVWNMTSHTLHGGASETRLKSVGVHANWHGYRRVEAVCNRYHHDAPFVGCQCGLWALKEFDAVERSARHYSAQAYGEVYMWGHVVECERGWRAQYAYPKHIYTYVQDLVEPFKETYGVPVEYKKWLALAETSTPTDHTSLVRTFITPGGGGYSYSVSGSAGMGMGTTYVSAALGIQSWVVGGNTTGGGTQLIGGSENTG